jgi:uncharacterized protein (TIGR02646 family)
MRAITKQGRGGFHLGQAHQTPPATPDQATSRWKAFRQHKGEVMRALLEEQFNLCCYSELRSDRVGLGHHVEHVENKSQNPGRTFDYTNLAASALDSRSDLGVLKARQEEAFGGHAKGKQQGVDMARFVSCHQTDCSRFFAYLSDGRTVPANPLDAQDTDRAQYTIDLLNLNSPYLVNLRQQWWIELEELFDEHQAKGWSLHALVSVDLIPRNQQLSQFFSLTRQFFGPVAQQVLQFQMPTLV